MLLALDCHISHQSRTNWSATGRSEGSKNITGLKFESLTRIRSLKVPITRKGTDHYAKKAIVLTLFEGGCTPYSALCGEDLPEIGNSLEVYKIVRI